MKVFAVASLLAAGASALTVRQTCTFQINAQGNRPVTEIADGQNRVNATALSPTTFYITASGGIYNATGSGCILTPPTTQFQCDVGVSPTTGFSIGSSGLISYMGNSTFYACISGGNGNNIYRTVTAGVETGCIAINLTATGCYNSGAVSSSSSRASSTSSSTRASSSAVAATSTSSRATTSSTSSRASTSSTSTRPATSSTMSSSSSRATTTSSSSSRASSSSSSSSRATTSSSVSSSRASSSTVLATSSSKASTSTLATTSSSKAPTSTPATTSSVRATTSSSSSSIRASTSSAAPATSSSGCPLNLPLPPSSSSTWQFPHLITPVNSASPNTAYGTSYFGVVNSTFSSIFNFDIPASYSGKTCTLVFAFPTQSQLTTSSYTISGNGAVDFKQLNTVATQSTTYSNMGSTKTDFGVKTLNPGSAYTITSFSCPAGSAVSYELTNAGSTALNYFQDYNPCALGLYITSA